MYLFLALPAHRPAPPSSQPVRGPNKNGEIVFTKSADLSSTGARITAMCNGAMGKLNPPVQPYYPLHGSAGSSRSKGECSARMVANVCQFDYRLEITRARPGQPAEGRYSSALACTACILRPPPYIASIF